MPLAGVWFPGNGSVCCEHVFGSSEVAGEQQAAEQPAEQRLHPRSDRVQGGGASPRDPAPGRVTATLTWP